MKADQRLCLPVLLRAAYRSADYRLAYYNVELSRSI